MPSEWAPTPEQYVGSSDPIALRPETYARHARAVDAVFGGNNARYPRPSRGRTTGPSAGAWARLQSGATITAAVGLTLGSGTVTLCSRVGGVLTADGADVTAYNSGRAITASGDVAVKLGWTDGVWSVTWCRCVC